MSASNLSCRVLAFQCSSLNTADHSLALEGTGIRIVYWCCGKQNLILLVLFRPLRLFMPAGNLRSARIVLLKITHLPYVGAIWAYEAAAQRFNGRSDSWRYTLQSHKRPLLSGQTNSLHRISRYSALRNQSEGSLLPKTPINESRTPGVKENDTVVELEHIWCDGNKIYGRIKQGSMDWRRKACDFGRHQTRTKGRNKKDQQGCAPDFSE